MRAPAASVDVALGPYCGLHGQSAAMRELYARVEQLAPLDCTVLVAGETGTGKELVARALHQRSPRARAPWVVLDCSALAANLIESELFGHERGAFTGAVCSREGAFERAHGGTLFLDELGELPLELQPKLLRVLEGRQVRRLGGGKTFGVNVRVVAATNRDLLSEVREGRFRADLYYRVAVTTVAVPPLRRRREDIPLLARHFLSQLGQADRHLDAETLAQFMTRPWPGNVRELYNAVAQQALALPAPQAPQEMEPEEDPALELLQVPIDVGVPFHQAKQRLVEEFDRRFVTALLRRHGGNISAAARAAGVDRMSIHKLLHRLGIRNPGRSLR